MSARAPGAQPRYVGKVDLRTGEALVWNDSNGYLVRVLDRAEMRDLFEDVKNGCVFIVKDKGQA